MKTHLATAILAVVVAQVPSISSADAIVSCGAPVVCAAPVGPLSFAEDLRLANAEVPAIIAVSETSAVIELDQATVFFDPVGAQSLYARFGSPDIVVLTRANPSHLSIDTMIGMLRRNTVVLAPQEVIDQLPLMISNNTFAPFDAGTAQEVTGIRFTALPATSRVPSGVQVHERNRGDIGVVLEVNGLRIYF